MAKTIATTNGSMTLQQARRIADRFVAKFPKAGADFPRETVQLVLDNEMELVVDDFLDVLRKRIESKLALASRGTTTITLTERHDPDSFYQTRSGLWVYDGFRNMVVAKAQPTEAGTVFKLDHALLNKNMKDEQIEASLPKNHLFDESVLCTIIAQMIAEQPNGKEGKLLNNGYANLFYTSSCVVYVYWHADYRGWHVRTWRRDDGGWDAGRQVFSPATGT